MSDQATRHTELTNMAMAVAEQADDVCGKAHARLWHLNNRLLELRRLIYEAQPEFEGSVCLELYGCFSATAAAAAAESLTLATDGKKKRTKPCLGCPHARWVQYRWIKVSPTIRNKGAHSQRITRDLNTEGVDPVLVVPAKFKNRAEVRDLIREAKGILKERAELVAAFHKLRAFGVRTDADTD